MGLMPTNMEKQLTPTPTIKRLSLYFNYLRELYEDGVSTISSQMLAEHFSLNPAQVRRDLSSFGQFGKRGAGYVVEELTWHIAEIMGIDKPKMVVVIGAGNLGTALLAYKGFSTHGFQIVAAFDSNPDKVGRPIRDKMCYPLSELPQIVARKSVDMAILATPEEVAQSVLEQIIASGIRAVLNFTTVQLSVPPGIHLVSVDLSSKLKTLSYLLTNRL